MSTNSRQSEVSYEQLLEFAVSIKEKLAAYNVTPERAVKSEKLRPVLIQAYHKAQQDQEEQNEDAAVAMLETDILGITPEIKERQKREQLEVESFERAVSWALAFANNQTEDLPVLRRGEGENVFFCGLGESVQCCDKNRKVDTFAILNDGVYGICHRAINVYKAATERMGGHVPTRLFYTSLVDAQRIVSEQKQLAPIVQWAYSFAYNKAEELPAENKFGEERYLCGLPGSVGCCDHTQPAKRFAVYKGNIYGLCQKAADAYLQCYLETGYRCVKTSDDLKKIKEIAASQQKDVPMIDWVNRFVAGETEKTGEEPVLRYSEGDAYIVCGLPESLGCCDHTQPAHGFPQMGGTVYGICKKGGWAYNDGRDRHNQPDCLKYTTDFDKAEFIAKKWLEYNGYGAVEESQANGSQSSAERNAREERRKANREARQAADDAARPKPNNGSGDPRTWKK